MIVEFRPWKHGKHAPVYQRLLEACGLREVSNLELKHPPVFTEVLANYEFVCPECETGTIKGIAERCYVKPLKIYFIELNGVRCDNDTCNKSFTVEVRINAEK